MLIQFGVHQRFESFTAVLTSSPAAPSEAEVMSEKLNALGAVHFEPVGANQVLLVENRVVGAEEPEVLKLKQTNKKLLSQLFFRTNTIHI